MPSPHATNTPRCRERGAFEGAFVARGLSCRERRPRTPPDAERQGRSSEECVPGAFCRGLCVAFRVSGSGFRVWGLGFGVWGLGFGVWGLGFGVWGFKFRVPGSGFRVSGSGFGV